MASGGGSGDGLLGHLLEEGDVVVDGFEEADEILVLGFGKGGSAGHDPDVLAAGDTDDGGLVIGIEVEDQVGGFERPKELHAPLGAGDGVMDEAGGIVGLERAIGSAAVESEGGGDGAVGIESVAFHGIPGVTFDEGGDVGDDVPISHETGKIDIGDKGKGFHGGRSGAASGGEEGKADQERGEGETEWNHGLSGGCRSQSGVGETSDEDAEREMDDEEEDWSGDDPGGEGMDAGPAEALEEIGDGKFGEGGEHAGDGEGFGGVGGPEAFTESDVGEDEDDLEGAEELVEGLEDGLVHAEAETDAEVEEGGGAEEGEEGTDGAGGEGGADAVGGDALGEEGEDGVEEATFPERRDWGRGWGWIRHGRGTGGSGHRAGTRGCRVR